MEEPEGGFGAGRGWGGGAWAGLSLNGNNVLGNNLLFGLAPPPDAAPLAARWRAALGLGDAEPSPSPPPLNGSLIRSGSGLLLPSASFSDLFMPLPDTAPPPWDWSAPAAVCNTPTAAAALAGLSADTDGTAAVTPTPVGSSHRDVPSIEVFAGVPPTGLTGHLLLDAPPLRIRLDNGAVLGPLDFERAAGVLSKKWRHTVHVAATGQPLGEWLDARGLGHLTARGVPPPPQYAAPGRASYGGGGGGGGMRAAGGGGGRGGFAPLVPRFSSPALMTKTPAATLPRGGFGADAWTTGAELGVSDEEAWAEEEEEEEGGRGGGGGGSDSEDYSPATRRRRAAARRRPRAPGSGGRKRKAGSDDEGGDRTQRRRKPSAATAAAAAAAGAAKTAGMSSRMRLLPGPEAVAAASLRADVSFVPFDPRRFVRITPLRRAHELRAAERRAPVALSAVLCGAGARVLRDADGATADVAGDDDDVAALRGSLPLRLRSAKGYRSALSTHGAASGALFAEVSLPRVGRTGAARLGFAPDAMPLSGPVGAAAAPPPDASSASAAEAAHDAAAAGVGVRGASGQTLLAGRAPSEPRGPTFGEGDVVGLYLYLPPASGDEAHAPPPADVVSLARATLRCGGAADRAAPMYLAAAAEAAAPSAEPLRGSAFLYRVNGGSWTLAAAHALPRRRYHVAISLFTDPREQAEEAEALFNPGPLFSYGPPSGAELAAAAAAGGAPELHLPEPRPFCALGVSVEDAAAAAARAPRPKREQQLDDVAGDVAAVHEAVKAEAQIEEVSAAAAAVRLLCEDAASGGAAEATPVLEHAAGVTTAPAEAETAAAEVACVVEKVHASPPRVHQAAPLLLCAPPPDAPAAGAAAEPPTPPPPSVAAAATAAALGAAPPDLAAL